MKEDIYQQVRCDLEIISYAYKYFEPATFFLPFPQAERGGFCYSISSFSTNYLIQV